MQLSLRNKFTAGYTKFDLAVFLFFLVFFLIGWTILPDYGISWDEFLQRRYGLMSFDYVVRKLNMGIELYYPDYYMQQSAGRQYSVIFSLIGAGLERFLGIDPEDFNAQFLLRHRMVFLLFFTACIAFYKILKQQIDEHGITAPLLTDWFPIMGTLIFILTPRTFAHSFFNPKDMVLLSFYVISIFTLLQFLKKPSVSTAIVHGVACAFVINARMPGMIVPVLTMVFLGIQFIRKPEKSFRRNYIITSPIFLITFFVLGIAFFPYLWEGVFQNATESFKLMSSFPKEFKVLLFEKYINSSPPPFYYPYVWMGITLPLLHLIILAGGLIWFIWNFLKSIYNKNLWTTNRSVSNTLFFSFFAGPLFAVWLFQSTLYDGWRHLYFIYPAGMLLGMMGLFRILLTKITSIKLIVWSILIVCCLQITYRMIQLHPHQQVYFNVLAGANKLERFEMDYWGVGYKQALEALSAQTPQGEISHFFCANQACIDNYFALPDEIKSKLKIRWGIEVAEFYVTNFRFKKELNKYKERAFPFKKELLSIEAGGEKIIGIYDLRK